ncbi:MAG: hypothetical protein Q8M67_04955 [Bacteroidota bacterium]|nr:hypothetical protein [Bacteroidota bacterium]
MRYPLPFASANGLEDTNNRALALISYDIVFMAKAKQQKFFDVRHINVTAKDNFLIIGCVLSIAVPH